MLDGPVRVHDKQGCLAQLCPPGDPGGPHASGAKKVTAISVQWKKPGLPGMGLSVMVKLAG